MSDLNGIISEVNEVSSGMKIIKIKPIGWEIPSFKPGQFCSLGLPFSAPRCIGATKEEKELKPDKIIKRAYSIASSSKVDELEFYITLVHSGALTPRIFNLKKGDKIQVGKRFVGMFTLDKVAPEKNIILIATGTGVAPYISMLRSDALTRKGKLTIVQGASNSCDLGYYSELKLLENVNEKLTYIPTITNPENESSNWTGEQKYIEDLWKEGIIAKKMSYNPTPENTHIFICGNPSMIETMQEIVEKEGFKKHSTKNPGQVHIESF